MANLFVRSSDGSDSDNGSTWALAKATIAGALGVASAGDTIYVSDNHAESVAAAISLTSPGTAASPCRILCVDDAGDPATPTTLATTATVTQTGSGNVISFAGFAYYYGIAFVQNVSSNSADIRFTSTSPWWHKFEACKFRILGTQAGQLIEVGTTTGNRNGQLLEFVNTTVEFGHVDQRMEIDCFFSWKDTLSAVAGATVPTILLGGSATGAGRCSLSGVDLSALGSGKNVINGAVVGEGIFELNNCKLGASVSLVSGTAPSQGARRVRAVNCDSSDTNYRYRLHTFQGDIFHETTIVRTGGASDGTTPISRKMVSSANAKLISPLASDPIVVWNETTGSSVTATVEVVTDNVTLTDAEAWIEVEYLGTGGFPITLFASDRVSTVLTTPTNQTTSSVTWTTTGLATPVKQKLSVSFTPQEKGPIQIRVHLAKASTTMYFCPKVDIA